MGEARRLRRAGKKVEKTFGSQRAVGQYIRATPRKPIKVIHDWDEYQKAKAEESRIKRNLTDVVRLCYDRAMFLFNRDLKPLKDSNSAAQKQYEYFIGNSVQFSKTDFYRQRKDEIDTIADGLDEFAEYIHTDIVRLRVAYMTLLREPFKDIELLPQLATSFLVSRILQVANEFYKEVHGQGSQALYCMVQGNANFIRTMIEIPSTVMIESTLQDKVTKEEECFSKKLAMWVSEHQR